MCLNVFKHLPHLRTSTVFETGSKNFPKPLRGNRSEGPWCLPDQFGSLSDSNARSFGWFSTSRPAPGGLKLCTAGLRFRSWLPPQHLLTLDPSPPHLGPFITAAIPLQSDVNDRFVWLQGCGQGLTTVKCIQNPIFDAKGKMYSSSAARGVAGNFKGKAFIQIRKNVAIGIVCLVEHFPFDFLFLMWHTALFWWWFEQPNTKYYSVSQNTTEHYSSITLHYKVLLRMTMYHKQLRSTTKHYSSTTRYYNVFLRITLYYILLLHTTKYSSSITKHNKELQSTVKCYPVLVRWIVATHETSSTLCGATSGMQNTVELRHAFLIHATHET